MTVNWTRMHSLGCSLLLAVGLGAGAQPGQKAPLTNQDVARMVQAGLAEPVIVETIQANPGNYDTTPDGLIALKQAGVTQKEMSAILASQHAAGGSGSTVAASAPASANSASSGPASASGAGWKMPAVALLQGGGSQPLPMEKTKLAETKTKPHSLASLAGDSAVTEGIQSGVNDVAWDAASHTHSGIADSGVLQAGWVFNSALSRREPTVTYVWGVPGSASANVLQTSTPKFSVDFARAPGVDPSQFAPEIVKLTPSPNNVRLVGATQGKQNARSRDAADWKIYSGFVEDRVAVNAQKSASGQYQISPQSPLLPGEYAVVLRPVSKDEKFSGGDVARAQGPGLMFDVLWSFQIADTAH
jgi:hypothetical protein